MTVYDGNGLFIEAGCFNTTAPAINGTVRGKVITPIISVINEDTASTNEQVTITYSRAPYGLVEGDRYVCARWNASVNCGGGGWTIKDCSLVTTPSGNFQCRCLHQGTFTLLDVSSYNYNNCWLFLPHVLFEMTILANNVQNYRPH